MQITDGWLAGVKRVPTPNFNTRPSGVEIDALVIHCISLPPEQFGGEDIEAFFQNRLEVNKHPYFKTIEGLEVSAHLLIKRDGECIQFVSFEERAWHAGQSCLHGQTACNDFSIGIELEGSDHGPFEEPQYECLAKVTVALQNQYPGIALDRIVGHSDIAPGRKTDPGPGFDWSHYRELIALESKR